MGKIVGLIFKDKKDKAENSDKYTCPHCGKEYKTEDNLNKHIQEKHPDAGSPAPEE